MRVNNSRAGRRPLPPNIRLLNGTDRPDRHEDVEIPVHAAVPDKPPMPDRASVVWDREIGKFTEVGLLTTLDGQMFAAYCEWVAITEECTEILAEEGLLITTPVGRIANPVLRLKMTAVKEMSRILTEFGASPASRSRVRMKPKKKDGADAPWDELDKKMAAVRGAGAAPKSA